MPFATTWMDLEIIILSEVNQRQIYAITYLWNLKINANKFIYKQKQTQRQRISLWLPKLKRGGD